MSETLCRNWDEVSEQTNWFFSVGEGRAHVIRVSTHNGVIMEKHCYQSPFLVIDNINLKTITLVLENRLIREGNEAQQYCQKHFCKDFFSFKIWANLMDSSIWYL